MRMFFDRSMSGPISIQSAAAARLRRRLDALLPEAAAADHLDAKAGIGTVSLRQFLAGLFSYAPNWARWLFRLRGGLAWLLRLEHEEFLSPPLRPEQLPFVPGARIKIFRVVAAQEDDHWIAMASDTHLDAWIAILVDGAEDERPCFCIYTIVRYKRWTGPVYFNCIRPFHHLLVRAMLRYALERPQDEPGP